MLLEEAIDSEEGLEVAADHVFHDEEDVIGGLETVQERHAEGRLGQGSGVTLRNHLDNIVFMTKHYFQNSLCIVTEIPCTWSVMFFCTMTAFFMTLTASFFSGWSFLWQRKTFPKAPRLMGFRIWKSSMEGGAPAREEGLAGGGYSRC